MSIHFPGGFSGPYRLIVQAIGPGHQAGQMNSPSNPQVFPVYVQNSIHSPMPQPYMMMAVPMRSFPVPAGNLPSRPVRIHPYNHPPLTEATKLLFRTLTEKRPLREVKKILDSGVPPNVRNEKGSTILNEAVFYERLDVIDELMRRGVNVNDPNADGLTPLHEAALRKRLNSVGKLCYWRANVNAKDATGKTPLHYSCMIEGNTTVILQLLKAGANINEPDQDGNTPMHIAAKYKQIGAITTLKEKGGNPHQKNSLGITPRDMYSVFSPAFARHVTIQVSEEQLQQPENGVASPESETPLPAANSLKSKKAAHSPEPQALTAFQFVDPLSELRTSLEQKGYSIADLDAIQEMLDSGENPFLKNEVDWATTEQTPLLIPASEDAVEQVMDNVGLWFTQNPLIEPADQNPASPKA